MSNSFLYIEFFRWLMFLLLGVFVILQIGNFVMHRRAKHLEVVSNKYGLKFDKNYKLFNFKNGLSLLNFSVPTLKDINIISGILNGNKVIISDYMWRVFSISSPLVRAKTVIKINNEVISIDRDIRGGLDYIGDIDGVLKKI